MLAVPKWHVDITLRQAVELSEKGRNCQYCHLESDAKGLEANTVLLISGGRDSYVTPEIADRLHNIVGRKAEMWIAPGAKHNMSRAIQREEYDRRVMAHVRKCLSPVTARSSTSSNDVIALTNARMAESFETNSTSCTRTADERATVLTDTIVVNTVVVLTPASEIMSQNI